jgi:hypothetical protein
MSTLREEEEEEEEEEDMEEVGEGPVKALLVDLSDEKS